MAWAHEHSIAVTETLHTASTAALQPFGLSVSDFVTLILNQLVDLGRLPSEFLVPNAATVAAMSEDTQPMTFTHLEEIFDGKDVEKPARVAIKQGV